MYRSLKNSDTHPQSEGVRRLRASENSNTVSTNALQNYLRVSAVALSDIQKFESYTQRSCAALFVLTLKNKNNGGLMDNAFEWLLSARKGEIVTEAAYPYASASGYAPSCKTSELASMPVGAVITGYKHLEKSEDTLAAYVLKQGPVAVAVDASSFQTYTGGILTNCISRGINHGVLAVGYDDVNVPPYWIIKNSWGTSWGESGYIRVAKGSNQCLINQYCTTAIVGSNATKH